LRRRCRSKQADSPWWVLVVSGKYDSPGLLHIFTDRRQQYTTCY
jgi:hypothetical protein